LGQGFQGVKMADFLGFCQGFTNRTPRIGDRNHENAHKTPILTPWKPCPFGLDSAGNPTFWPTRGWQLDQRNLSFGERASMAVATLLALVVTVTAMSFFRSSSLACLPSSVIFAFLATSCVCCFVPSFKVMVSLPSPALTTFPSWVLSLSPAFAVHA